MSSWHLQMQIHLLVQRNTMPHRYVQQRLRIGITIGRLFNVSLPRQADYDDKNIGKLRSPPFPKIGLLWHGS